MVITTATMAIIQAISTIMAITTVTIILSNYNYGYNYNYNYGYKKLILVTTTTTNQVLTAIVMAVVLHLE